VPFVSSQSLACKIGQPIPPWLCCRLVTDRQTGRHRGFGFCEYYHKASACAAIKRINGQEFQGKRLKVAALVGSGESFTLTTPMYCLDAKQNQAMQADPYIMQLILLEPIEKHVNLQISFHDRLWCHEHWVASCSAAKTFSFHSSALMHTQHTLTAYGTAHIPAVCSVSLMLYWLVLQMGQASMMRDLSAIKGLTKLRGLRNLTDLTIRLPLLRWDNKTSFSTFNHQLPVPYLTASPTLLLLPAVHAYAQCCRFYMLMLLLALHIPRLLSKLGKSMG